MSYVKAANLEEALEVLKKATPEARVIAGGTDLYLQDWPGCLVDISFLDDLKMIEEKDDMLEIGAAVTHAMAAGSDLVKYRATALAEACKTVGSPQIRNMGTLGGNVINAAPAADAAVALVALGAEGVLINCENIIRRVPVDNLYAGYNRTVIDCGSEILLKFVFDPCKPGEGSAFVRFAARRALALPMVNAAARIRIEDDLISAVHLVVAPVKPAPARLLKTEAKLRGKPVGEETWFEAEQLAAGEAEVRGSLLRCSADYRKHLVGVLTGRVLRTAARRALERKV